MDDFKKYIRQRADDLDIDMPRERVWQAVKQEVKYVKPNIALVYMKWAVAACIIGLAGFGAFALLTKDAVKPIKVAVKQNTQTLQITAQPEEDADIDIKPKSGLLVSANETPKKQKTVVAKQPKTIIEKKNPEVDWAALRNVENSFTQVINLQKAKVNTTPLNAESPAYFSDFKAGIRQMEKDEKTIKKEIETNGLTDELLEQLINIYQQKLNVLKQLQNEIHKTNNRFKQNRGPVDTTKPYFLNI